MRVDDANWSGGGEYAEFLDLKRALKALGDVARLQIIATLGELGAGGEMIVTDLAETLHARGLLVSQPLVSWHLSILRRAGMVRTRRRGRQVYCSLDAERYRACLGKLSHLVPGGEPSSSATAPRAASFPASGAAPITSAPFEHTPGAECDEPAQRHAPVSPTPATQVEDEEKHRVTRRI